MLVKERDLSIFNSKRVSHAFLIEVDEEYNTDFSKNIVKKILQNIIKDEIKLKEILTLIDCDNFPELKIIRPNGKTIKKEQLTNLMIELKNKPIHSKNVFYIIEYAENLNNSSANTILKFLEEPEEGIIAILITKNRYEVLPTIISRCQIISFNKYKKKEYDEVSIGYAIQIIKCFQQNKNNSIAYLSEIYSLKSEELIEILNLCIIIYSDILNYTVNGIRAGFIKINNELNDIIDIFSAQEITTMQKKLLEALNLLKYNVNVRIVLDKVLVEEVL